MAVADRVEALAKQLGATAHTVRLAAAHVLMHRHARGDEPIMVTPERASRVAIDDRQTFREVVRQVAATQPEAANGALTLDLPLEPMIDRLHKTLEEATADPDRPIAFLPVMPTHEWDTVVVEWNETRVRLPNPVCLHELFATQVRRTPHATAVVCGDVRLTYAELDAKANRLAHLLQDRGVEPESGVGVCMERTEETVVAFLAVLKAGGAYIPIDPDYPNERIATMIAEARPEVLVTDSVLAKTLPVDRETCVLLDLVEPDLAALPIDAPPCAAGVDNLCAAIFTSGSTGVPKCAMLTHANIANYIGFWTTCHLDATPMRTHLQMTSFAFVIFLADLTRALFTGARLVICPREVVLAPDELYDLMVKESVNTAEFVPPVLKLLVDAAEAGGRRLDFLDLLVAGGDAWRAPDYLRAKALCAPTTHMIAAYGMTETSIDNTVYVDGEVSVADAVVPIGRPTPNTRLYVLDANLQPLPPGVPGELYVAGLGVCRGYLRRPALTAERFLPEPYSGVDGARMYRTGDRARWRPDGVLEILGRTDSQVKIDGVRIELGEIEATLRDHPAVADGVVLAHGDADDPRLTAFVVLDHIGARREQAVLDEIQMYLRDRLPSGHLPNTINRLAAIGLNVHGKIDRRTLAEQAGTAPVSTTDGSGERVKVVVNAHGQFSIWPAGLDTPAGWTEEGPAGTKPDCLAYIERVWTDMRPRGLEDG